jgi:hypothetical protein
MKESGQVLAQRLQHTGNVLRREFVAAAVFMCAKVHFSIGFAHTDYNRCTSKHSSKSQNIATWVRTTCPLPTFCKSNDHRRFTKKTTTKKQRKRNSKRRGKCRRMTAESYLLVESCKRDPVIRIEHRHDERHNYVICRA